MFHSKSTSFAGVGLGTSFRENLGFSDQKDSKKSIFSNFSKACCFEFFHPKKKHGATFLRPIFLFPSNPSNKKTPKIPKDVISFRCNFGIHWNWIFCKKSQKSKKQKKNKRSKKKTKKKNPKSVGDMRPQDPPILDTCPEAWIMQAFWDSSHADGLCL